jgi:hypothetical protein
MILFFSSCYLLTFFFFSFERFAFILFPFTGLKVFFIASTGLKQRTNGERGSWDMETLTREGRARYDKEHSEGEKKPSKLFILLWMHFSVEY